MRISKFAMLGLSSFLLTTGASRAADIVEPVVYQPPVYSFYIAGRLGAVFQDDSGFRGHYYDYYYEEEEQIKYKVNYGVDTDYDTGINGSIAIGGRFNVVGYDIRGEIEGGYMTSAVDSHSLFNEALFDGKVSFSGDDADGDLRVVYGLVNAYVDFGSGAFKPYISGGIGIAGVEYDNFGVLGLDPVVDDSATGFAWQIGAGVSYDFTSRLTGELGYRYFSVESASLEAFDGTEVDADVSSNQVNIGLRIAF